MNLNLIKQNNELRPVYKYDRENYDRLKNNTIYSCIVRQANNPAFNAKMHAIAQTVCDNLPEESSLYGVITKGHDLIKATQMTLHFTKWVVKLNGEKYEEPESISFQSWDNIRRQEFYEKALPIWAAMISITVEELENNSEVNL